MLIPTFLHDVCWVLTGFVLFVVIVFMNCLICACINWDCVCLCVTVGSAPSRECTRLSAVCRHASPHSSSYPTPAPRAPPIFTHSPINRHYLICPSPSSGPQRIPRPPPDGWAWCTVGLGRQWGWGGRVTGHGHICSRTGWDSHGSGETGECAGPHRAFYCECWEMEEQRERGGRVVGRVSPRVLHRLNKVSLKKPSDQMCP